MRMLKTCLLSGVSMVVIGCVPLEREYNYEVCDDYNMTCENAIEANVQIGE